MKYRKKPVVIEAMQWDGTAEAATEIIDWIHAHGGTARYTCTSEPCSYWEHVIAIDTLEGTMNTDMADWVIKGVQDEFYPCKPLIFVATYEEAE